MRRNLLDPNDPAHQELMQEIQRRYKNKNMLFKYLTEKTVSAFEFDQVSCVAHLFAEERVLYPQFSLAVVDRREEYPDAERCPKESSHPKLA